MFVEHETKDFLVVIHLPPTYDTSNGWRQLTTTDLVWARVVSITNISDQFRSDTDWINVRRAERAV